MRKNETDGREMATAKPFVTPIGNLKLHTADKVKLCSFQVWAFLLLITIL